MVATSDDREKSEIGVSADFGVLPLNTRDKFNKNLSLSIIRLTNYNITTSLIYELLL